MLWWQGEAVIISSPAEQAPAFRLHLGGWMQVTPTNTCVLSTPFLAVHYNLTLFETSTSIT